MHSNGRTENEHRFLIDFLSKCWVYFSHHIYSQHSDSDLNFTLPLFEICLCISNTLLSFPLYILYVAGKTKRQNKKQIANLYGKAIVFCNALIHASLPTWETGSVGHFTPLGQPVMLCPIYYWGAFRFWQYLKIVLLMKCRYHPVGDLFHIFKSPILVKEYLGLFVTWCHALYLTASRMLCVWRDLKTIGYYTIQKGRLEKAEVMKCSEDHKNVFVNQMYLWSPSIVSRMGSET